MGEYAMYAGQRVKIGTCEDLYYLREEHRDRVQPLAGNVDVRRRRELAMLRFRFPGPDEDATAAPGEDNDGHEFDRGLGVSMPWNRLGNMAAKLKEAEHGSIQLSRDYGNGQLLASIPCPNGTEALPLTLHRNGWGRGDVILYQQGYRPAASDSGLLVLAGIAGCAFCGSKFWLPLVDAEEIAVAIRAEADRTTYQAPDGLVPYYDVGEKRRGFLHTVADRLLAGYEKRLATLSVVPAA